MKPYRKYFEKAISQSYPNQYSEICGEIETNFSRIRPAIDFAAHSSNPIDLRLELAAYFLAAIIVLDKRRADYPRIRELMIRIATQYVQPRNKLESLLKRIPPKLPGTSLGAWLLKKFDNLVSKAGNPAGFIARIITDKEETYGFGYGFDIIECGICKLYEKYDYSRFASLFCEIDHITSGLAGLTLIRTGTIANGAHKCDFRFKRN